MPDSGSRRTLSQVLSDARVASGLSLRDVERRIGVRSGHLSQLETGTIVKPEMALLWELAALYDVDFAALLECAGYTHGDDTHGGRRHRMTVALRALEELTPAEQTDALAYMADLKARRGDG
jgi:transcriptional regulator with XRE-family HTH domain